MALYELLRATGNLTHSKMALFRSQSTYYWWRHFNLAKKRFDENSNTIVSHRGRTIFGFSFATNGAYACVSLQKSRNDNTTTMTIKKPYSEYLGLDPGVVNFVGACYSRDDDKRRENFVLKSSTFKQSHCGERLVRRRRQRIVGKYENRLLEPRKLLPDMTARCTADFKNNSDYVQHRLEHLRDDQRVYGKTRLNKLHWWSKTL